MINVTSQYPTQTFLPVANAQIVAQVNQMNTANTPIAFPRVFRRTAFATAPDNSGAKMFQYDVLLNNVAFYAYQLLKDAQSDTLQVAASRGHEYYIELAPLNSQYYQILTWTSNL